MWFIDSTVGSKIAENGLYRAGVAAGTDTVTVIDKLNENNTATVTITISPLWPIAYDKMWGAKKGKNLSLLRKFRDEVLVDSKTGRDYTFMLYNNSLEILILLFQNPSLTRETKDVIDELLPDIESLLNGEKVSLSDKQVTSIEMLCDHFKQKKASPQLQKAIKKVRTGIRKGELFRHFEKMDLSIKKKN